MRIRLKTKPIFLHFFSSSNAMTWDFPAITRFLLCAVYNTGLAVCVGFGRFFFFWKCASMWVEAVWRTDELCEAFLPLTLKSRQVWIRARCPKSVSNTCHTYHTHPSSLWDIAMAGTFKRERICFAKQIKFSSLSLTSHSQLMRGSTVFLLLLTIYLNSVEKKWSHSKQHKLLTKK